MRNLGGPIGITVCGTRLNDRTHLHFLHLSEHLTTSNPGTQALDGDDFFPVLQGKMTIQMRNGSVQLGSWNRGELRSFDG